LANGSSSQRAVDVSGRTLVVKIGGTKGVNFAAICRDAAALAAPGSASQGLRLVLVHGGSAEADELGEALGHPARTITSPSGYTSRYTDRRTLEIFAAAVNGKVNTLIVEQLQSLEINALGLCGLDGRLLQAVRKEAVQSVENGKRRVIRDDFTGKIMKVNTSLLEMLLAAGYLPVVAPLAAGQNGEALNVDADRAAAMIASGLQADTLLLLTGSHGLLRSFPDERTLIRHLPAQHLEEALGYAQGRMKKKVLGASEAIQGGVPKVIIADGRVEQPILQALAGQGTLIE
jgi:[amino group carrier protein]-L-2-aminoadipate 6-kinase